MSVIAIVDDDDAVRLAIQALLRSLGHRVFAFASAEEFLHSEQMEEVKCLITDVLMPGMSGIDLLAWLKSRGHRIPAIVMITFADESVRDRAMQLGALSFLTKPFGEAALTSCLAEALD